MAKKSVEGQMDLFELFGSVEELEEKVKGVPELEKLPPTAPVMQRCFCSSGQNNTAVVAYLDYNMVYLKDWEDDPVIYQFEHSKDAVDFYVKQMERFLSDKKVKIQKEQEPLVEASIIPWTKE